MVTIDGKLVRRAAKLLKAKWNSGFRRTPDLLSGNGLWGLVMGRLVLGGFAPIEPDYWGECEVDWDPLNKCREMVFLRNVPVPDEPPPLVEPQETASVPRVETRPAVRIYYGESGEYQSFRINEPSWWARRLMRAVRAVANGGPKSEYFGDWEHRYPYGLVFYPHEGGHVVVMYAFTREELKALHEWMEGYTRTAKLVEIDREGMTLWDKDMRQEVDIGTMHWEPWFPIEFSCVTYPMLSLIDAMAWVLEGTGDMFSFVLGQDWRFVYPDDEHGDPTNINLPLTIVGEDRFALVPPRRA